MQMQFKNPEFLYFLALLAVPILVHLLQLRRFKPMAFTNVAALKQLQTQSRKSSQLKRYLLLAARLLFIAAIVLAFAGPFLPAFSNQQQATRWAVILDNTHSMQAQGSKGSLLEEAKQALMQHLPADAVIDLYTADQQWESVTRNELQNEWSKIAFTALNIPYETIAAKYEKAHEPVQVLVITDGADAANYPANKWVRWHQWQLHAQQKNNTWIAGARVQNLAGGQQQLEVELATNHPSEQLVSLAVYHGKEVLAKTMTALNEGKKTVQLAVEVDNAPLEIRIEEPGLPFDNQWFMATQTQAVNPVVVIGDPTNAGIFNRLLHNESQFPLTHMPPAQLDFRQLEQASLIVLNQIDEPTPALLQQATEWTRKGKNIVYIPGTQAALANWNTWMAAWKGPQYQTNPTPATVRLNEIVQNHPLLRESFEHKVSNFQYPQLTKFYHVNQLGQVALKLDDGSPFLGQYRTKSGFISLFAQPLQHAQSNFKQSPLAVVALYNLVLQAQQVGLNQLTIGQEESLRIAAPTTPSTLQVEGEQTAFIPVARPVDDQMELLFDQLPTQAGIYHVKADTRVLTAIGFNYARTESNQSATPLPAFVQAVEHISDYWNTYQQHTSDTPFWKALLWIAFIALLLELLIQKLLK